MTAAFNLDDELNADAEAPLRQIERERTGAGAALQTALSDDAGAVPAKAVGLVRRAVRTMEDGKEGARKAVKLCLKAIDAAPDFALAYQAGALALERLGRLSAALSFYEEAYKRDPNNSDLYLNLGLAAWKLDMLPAAEKFLRLHLQLEPASIGGTCNLAGLLRDMGRFDDSIELLRTRIYADAENPDLWNSLGTTLLEAGDTDQAATFYKEALRLKPDYARAHHNMAFTLELSGQTEAAVASFERALELPATQSDRDTMEHGLSLALLASGRVKEGWAKYEARLRPGYRNCTYFALEGPRWDGVDPAELRGKTVLIVGEQGLGDEVMFMPVMHDVIDAVGPDGEVRLAVERRLVEIAKATFPGVKVDRHFTIAKEGKDVRLLQSLTEDVDIWAPMATPLRAFRPSADSFPAGHLLTADEADVAAFRDQLADFGPGLKVGLLWKSLKMTGNRLKYFSGFEAWKPVLQIPGVEFVNLQYGEVAEDLKRAQDEFGVTIHQPEGLDLKDDLAKVAALGKACDLVIGPMNTSSNLTAAVGGAIWIIHSQKRAWTMMGADELPWYPNTRSFGGDTRFGDWKTVMADVAEALRAEAAKAKAA